MQIYMATKILSISPLPWSFSVRIEAENLRFVCDDGHGDDAAVLYLVAPEDIERPSPVCSVEEVWMQGFKDMEGNALIAGRYQRTDIDADDGVDSLADK